MRSNERVARERERERESCNGSNISCVWMMINTVQLDCDTMSLCACACVCPLVRAERVYYAYDIDTGRDTMKKMSNKSKEANNATNARAYARSGSNSCCLLM